MNNPIIQSQIQHNEAEAASHALRIKELREQLRDETRAFERAVGAIKVLRWLEKQPAPEPAKSSAPADAPVLQPPGKAGNPDVSVAQGKK